MRGEGEERTTVKAEGLSELETPEQHHIAEVQTEARGCLWKRELHPVPIVQVLVSPVSS